MGLDAVELILEIEDAFEVKIPDEVAAEIRTVGELHDFLVDQRRACATLPDRCLSAAAFYALRRAACAQLGLVRRSIRPDVSLASTFPRERRVTSWAELQAALGLKLPRLVRPTRIVAVAAVLSIAAAVSAAYFAYGTWGRNGATAVFIATLIAVGALAAAATSPLQTEFPPLFSTFGRLSHVVLARNYATLNQGSEAWNPNDVWDVLKVIIVEQLNVRPEAVTRDALFVNDLGMQ